MGFWSNIKHLNIETLKYTFGWTRNKIHTHAMFEKNKKHLKCLKYSIYAQKGENKKFIHIPLGFPLDNQ